MQKTSAGGRHRTLPTRTTRPAPGQPRAVSSGRTAREKLPLKVAKGPGEEGCDPPAPRLRSAGFPTCLRNQVCPGTLLPALLDLTPQVLRNSSRSRRLGQSLKAAPTPPPRPDPATPARATCRSGTRIKGY